MKNIFKRIAVVLMAVIMCVMLVACSDQGPKGETGPQGATGAQGPQGEQGQAGADGTKWFTGRGLPSSQQLDEAKSGDFYINLNTNTVYVKGATSWTVLTNVNEKNNVSKWDGKIPGWQAPDLPDGDIIANRPVSYVVNEETKNIDLYNAEAFAWFAYRAVIGKVGYKGYTVNLHCDVDLDNRMWVPIGLGARSNAPRMAFQGVFDGGGHTIYNLNSGAFTNSIKYGEYTPAGGGAAQNGYYIDYHYNYGNGVTDVKIPFQVKENRESYTGANANKNNSKGFKEADEFTYGLFAKVTDATIKNLNVKGVSINLPEVYVENAPNYLKTDAVGAIVGYASGNVTIENCTSGKADHGENIGYIKNCNTAAGIIGRAYAGHSIDGKYLNEGDDTTYTKYGNINIIGCTNNLDVISPNEKAAGIVAYPCFASEIVIKDCVNNGKIEGTYAAGIMSYSSTVARESVTIEGVKHGILTKFTIADCANNGEIASNTYAGGIIGFRLEDSTGDRPNSKTVFSVTHCENRGNLTLKGANKDAYAGGIVAQLRLSCDERGVMLDCCNYGDLIIENPETDTATMNRYVGNLIGSLTFKKAKTNAPLSGFGKLTIAGLSSGKVINNSTATRLVLNAESECFGKITYEQGASKELCLTELYLITM